MARISYHALWNSRLVTERQKAPEFTLVQGNLLPPCQLLAEFSQCLLYTSKLLQVIQFNEVSEDKTGTDGDNNSSCLEYCHAKWTNEFFPPRKFWFILFVLFIVYIMLF
jgi:hypothetical protein